MSDATDARSGVGLIVAVVAAIVYVGLQRHHLVAACGVDEAPVLVTLAARPVDGAAAELESEGAR